MLVTTFIPATIAVLLIQLVIFKLRIRWLSYGLSLGLGGIFLSNGVLQLTLIGVEVAGLGCLVTRIDPLGHWS